MAQSTQVSHSGMAELLTIDRDPMETVYKLYGPAKLACIPADCTGMTVLDIGGYDGRFGFVAKQRGAKSVLVLDNQDWRRYHGQRWPDPKRFPELDYAQGDFMEEEGDYDLVLFFNVLYHCDRWGEALPKVKLLTKKILCLSTYWADGTASWHQYSDEGLTRATPTIPGLFQALGESGFQCYDYVQVVEKHVIVRCS